MLSGLAIAVLLGGCETLTAERPHKAWALTEEGAGLRLSLGAADLGEPSVSLTCRARSGRIDFTLAGREGDPAVMELRSGDLIQRYAGAGHAAADNPGVMLIEFPVDAGDAVMRRVYDTGELRIAFGDRRIHLPNAFAPGHDFLRVCRRD